MTIVDPPAVTPIEIPEQNVLALACPRVVDGRLVYQRVSVCLPDRTMVLDLPLGVVDGSGHVWLPSA